jgi:hypothetical protein
MNFLKIFLYFVDVIFKNIDKKVLVFGEGFEDSLRGVEIIFDFINDNFFKEVFTDG